MKPRMSRTDHQAVMFDSVQCPSELFGFLTFWVLVISHR